MYIDFEDLRPETPRVERALSVREGVLISIIVHLLIFIGVLFLPDLPQAQPARAALANPVPRESPRFVFMQPRIDVPKPQPKVNVEASDQDRVLSSPIRPPDPRNALPFARGNSREREEAEVAPPNRGAAEESSVAQGRPNPAAEGQMTANDPSRSMLKLPDNPSATPGAQTR